MCLPGWVDAPRVGSDALGPLIGSARGLIECPAGGEGGDGDRGTIIVDGATEQAKESHGQEHIAPPECHPEQFSQVA